MTGFASQRGPCPGRPNSRSVDSVPVTLSAVQANSRRPVPVVVLVVVIGVLGLVPTAGASYPGAAGALAFQRSSAYTIENDNGVTSQNFALALQGPAGGAFGTPLSCQAFDGNFGDQGDQYCPQSPPSFAPDGQSLAFSGVMYHSDGSAVPSQAGCLDSNPCRRTIVVAAADGSAPRPMTLPMADAEQPAFLPDGQQLIFAGAATDGMPDDLYAVNLDGTGLRRLTTTGASEPAPCPDGSVAYVHRGDLYLRGAGGGTRRLTRSGGTWPDCSHDSRTLFFDRHAGLYTISVTGRRLRHLTSPNTPRSGCPRPTSHRVLCVQGRPAASPAGGLVALAAVSVCTSHCGGPSFPPQCTNLSERLVLIDLRGHVRRSDRVATNECQPDFGLADDQLDGVAWRPLPSGA
jgi:WD40-like Beta Propeller Repeat